MLRHVPPFSWPVNPVDAAHGLDAASRGYLMWSVWSVDSLHYLHDLDQRPERLRWTSAGHHPDTVDVAHARWAAGTALTALDVGAAILGVQHSLSTEGPGHVYSIFELDEYHRPDLCNGCLRWLDGVITDPDHEMLKRVRNPLTHRMLGRALYATINDSVSGRKSDDEPSPDDRLGLLVPVKGKPRETHEIAAAEIVELARDTATRHVVALVRAAESRAL